MQLAKLHFKHPTVYHTIACSESRLSFWVEKTGVKVNCKC